jgi:hypothetical protein
LKKLKGTILFLLFLCSLFYIIGTAGALELDNVSIMQTVIRFIPGFACLGISTICINQYLREGESDGEENRNQSDGSSQCRSSDKIAN